MEPVVLVDEVASASVVSSNSRQVPSQSRPMHVMESTGKNTSYQQAPTYVQTSAGVTNATVTTTVGQAMSTSQSRADRATLGASITGTSVTYNMGPASFTAGVGNMGTASVRVGSSTMKPTSMTIDTQNTGNEYISRTEGSSPMDRTETSRKISSVILESVPMSTPPGDTERVVEVPTYEEQITYIPVKEVREVEKRVNVPVYETVERVVAVKPNPVYRDVETIEYYDEPVEVKVPTYHDRIVETIVEKRVPTTVEVYKEVEVAPVVVEVPVFDDEEVPVIISQTVKPVITESKHNYLDVNVVDYEPEVIPVDVHVAKPIASSVEAAGVTSTHHKLVNITSAQYNTILRSLNTHLDEKARQQLPFVAENNLVNFVAEKDSQYIIAPSDIEVEGYRLKPQSAHSHTASNVQNTSYSAAPRPSPYPVPRQATSYSAAPQATSYSAAVQLSNAPQSNQTGMVAESRAPEVEFTVTGPTAMKSEKKSYAICCQQPASSTQMRSARAPSSNTSSEVSSSDTSSDIPSKTMPKYHHIGSHKSGPSNSRASSHRVETLHSYRSGPQSRPQPRSRVCC